MDRCCTDKLQWQKLDYVRKVPNLPGLCYKIQIMYACSDRDSHLMGITNTAEGDAFSLP